MEVTVLEGEHRHLAESVRSIRLELLGLRSRVRSRRFPVRRDLRDRSIPSETLVCIHARPGIAHVGLNAFDLTAGPNTRCMAARALQGSPMLADVRPRRWNRVASWHGLGLMTQQNPLRTYSRSSKYGRQMLPKTVLLRKLATHYASRASP